MTDAATIAEKPIFKPMLSGKAPADLSANIKFPVYVSPKLDGIRAIKLDGQIVSRNLKPIPNEHVQRQLSSLPDGFDGELIVGEPTGSDVWNRSQSGVMRKDGEPEFTFWIFDGELIVGEPTGSDVWNRSQSGVMRKDGEPEFTFWIFDWWLPNFPINPFSNRLYMVREHLLMRDPHTHMPAQVVMHHLVKTVESLKRWEDSYVKKGYEGAMIRDPDGVYKCGRSTVREGGLLKLKRWYDAEAAVINVVEEMHNANAAEKDELGRTKRSSSKAGKVGKGVLGALVCRLPSGVEFEIGTGFTAQQRKDLWDAWHAGEYQPPIGCPGKLVKFKYQELTPDGVPRFPVFLGFRDARDA